MTRDEFLRKHWRGYPAADPQAVAQGRFLGWLSSEKVLLWRHETQVEWTVQQSEICGFLIHGDLISVAKSGEITLVAPWRALGVFQPKSSEFIRAFSNIKNLVGQFFIGQNFLEVMTPSLVRCPGTEPSLEVFQTEWRDGSYREVRFLPTSPELHLKKALAIGWENVFEIRSCFRNGEITEAHQPEFTMIEWYRSWRSLDAIADDVLGLIEFVQAGMSGHQVRTPSRIRRVTMAQLFREHLQEEIRPESSREDYMGMARRLGIRVTEDDSIDDLFFQLFTEKIERGFDPETLMIVSDWPPFQAALARVGASGWAERFEVYWQGLELANAFHELNDPEIQRQRFSEDLLKKVRMGKANIPLDEDFLKALESGIPPSAGIALGVDRLAMAMLGVKTISELRAFPELRD